MPLSSTLKKMMFLTFYIKHTVSMPIHERFPVWLLIVMLAQECVFTELQPHWAVLPFLKTSNSRGST